MSGLTPKGVFQKARIIPQGHIESFAHAFRERVQYGPRDECWPWRGGKTKRGYGVLKVQHIRYAAHRFSVVLDGRQLGEDDIVCHRCDNPICVNPNHLYVGTPLDNARDRKTRGRQVYPTGESHHRSKLTAGFVRAIRRSAIPHAMLAREYGVSEALVRKIKNQQIWRCV